MLHISSCWWNLFTHFGIFWSYYNRSMGSNSMEHEVKSWSQYAYWMSQIAKQPVTGLVPTTAELTGFLDYQQLDYRNSSVHRKIKIQLTLPPPPNLCSYSKILKLENQNNQCSLDSVTFLEQTNALLCALICYIFFTMHAAISETV
jgi:hypothetical protein